MKIWWTVEYRPSQHEEINSHVVNQVPGDNADQGKVEIIWPKIHMWYDNNHGGQEIDDEVYCFSVLD